MRRIKLLFVVLLVFVSISQIGATGFAPNMFVAQKQLNQPSTSNTTTHKESTSVVAPKKESSSEKERTKEPFRFSEKKLKPEMSDRSLEMIEVDSLVSTLSRSILQWLLLYVTSLV